MADFRDRLHRRKSYNLSGHAHELTFTCYHRYPFLRAERTCQWLAESIGAARAKHGFKLWAYVFMPEHVHLLLFPRNPEYAISRILQDIKGPVGRKAIRHLQTYDPAWLTRISRQRGGRTERLFWQSGGGYDRNVFNPEVVWKQVEYIHANPVRKGLTQSVLDWRWSSARWYATGEAGPIVIDSMEEARGVA